MDFPLIPGLGALSEPPRDFRLLQINPSAIQGESGTGFEKRGDKGPFSCGNCEYFDAAAGACDQWDMKTKSNQPKLADGRVSVDAADCCEYVERVGKVKDDHDEDDDGR
jgi:hypothetical protein